jgi:hypothetical protein
LVQELARDDHEQEDPETAEDQSDEMSLPERFFLFGDRHPISVCRVPGFAL